MNFSSLVWYSSLAIGDEKNSYVADFLNRSCELLNEEINEEIKFDLSDDNLYEFKGAKYTKDDIIKLVKHFEK